MHRAEAIMSLLLVYPESQPDRLLSSTGDGAEIARQLARHGIRFERWTCTPLPDTATSEQVLAAYAAEVERVVSEGGYRHVDVARLRPDPSDPGWPDKARAARAKFLEEHRHAEDEVRFFVEGSGLFVLRLDGEVLQILCERGDLLSVPAGTRHWFDMGTEPSFCAIRFFGTTEGWVATFTGDPIAARFPTFDRVVRDQK
jgi:1,2-dihydroxy-3-keto-5-methylthiopentene dioxygenase